MRFGAGRCLPRPVMIEGLNERGQEIYKALTDNRDITAAHKIMALNAARLADTLDRIDIELALNPNLTVTNGQGTRTVNPLITESRMITGALSQILAKMGISELPDAKSGEKSKFDELAERRATRRATDGASVSTNSM